MPVCLWSKVLRPPCCHDGICPPIPKLSMSLWGFPLSLSHFPFKYSLPPVDVLLLKVGSFIQHATMALFTRVTYFTLTLCVPIQFAQFSPHSLSHFTPLCRVSMQQDNCHIYSNVTYCHFLCFKFPRVTTACNKINPIVFPSFLFVYAVRMSKEHGSRTCIRIKGYLPMCDMGNLPRVVHYFLTT